MTAFAQYQQAGQLPQAQQEKQLAQNPSNRPVCFALSLPSGIVSRVFGQKRKKFYSRRLF